MTLCVTEDAERPDRRYHAERGNAYRDALRHKDAERPDRR
jgi:hypothetical protein